MRDKSLLYRSRGHYRPNQKRGWHSEVGGLPPTATLIGEETPPPTITVTIPTLLDTGASGIATTGIAGGCRRAGDSGGRADYMPTPSAHRLLPAEGRCLDLVPDLLLRTTARPLLTTVQPRPPTAPALPPTTPAPLTALGSTGAGTRPSQPRGVRMISCCLGL